MALNRTYAAESSHATPRWLTLARVVVISEAADAQHSPRDPLQRKAVEGTVGPFRDQLLLAWVENGAAVAGVRAEVMSG
ncbi:hypothetical protein [Nocardia sp. NPDC050710]|uniref:hypothetical protein n=1 Tax=Nocardia sp. NPDC050710 TaxID=3157220 RepID=UPI0033CEF91A